MLKSSATKLVLALAVVSAFSAYPTKLLADPIVAWTIANGTQMAGGASVSGSFLYDATTNTYTDVNIAVGDDPNPLFYVGTIPGDTYLTSYIVGDSSSTFLDLLDPNTNTGFQLYFFNALTDAGGVDPTGLHLLVGGNLADYETPGSIPYNTSVSGIQTPEPPTVFVTFFGMLAVLVVTSRWKPTV